MVVCRGHRDALVAVGTRQSRRGVVSPSCRLMREILDNLLDLWTFMVIGVPTSNKELPESIRYTQVDGIGRLCGTIALENLESNLRTPERIKRNQPSQHLVLYFSIRPDISEGGGDGGIPVGSPSRTRTHLLPLTAET